MKCTMYLSLELHIYVEIYPNVHLYSMMTQVMEKVNLNVEIEVEKKRSSFIFFLLSFSSIDSLEMKNWNDLTQTTSFLTHLHIDVVSDVNSVIVLVVHTNKLFLSFNHLVLNLTK